MTTPISNDNKKIAKILTATFSGRCSVTEFLHDSLPLVIHILHCPDHPGETVSSFGTIGLSDTPLYLKKKEYPVRVELVGAIATRDREVFSHILGTTAFCIMRKGEIVHPGSVIENAVREYIPETGLPHIFMTEPFLWEEQLRPKDLETKKVAWLIAFPISQAELEFLSENDADALEDLFQEANIDIFDLERESIL